MSGALGDTAAQTWMPPYVWFAGLLLGMPLFVFVPAHFLLSRVMPKARTDAGARSEAKQVCSRWRFALRFAWRDLRGGLRGFGVFIACIALGVMAIAGVGSVAASLNDGIAGAGRVILGGDLAFSLIQRKATTPSARSSTPTARSRSPPACARMNTPGPPTAARRWSRSKRSTAIIRCSGSRDRSGDAAAGDVCGNDGAFGAAVDPTLLTRLDLKTGDRITHRQCRDRTARGTDRRARQACRRHRARPARADQRGRAARHRAPAARKPGALAIPAASAGKPMRATARWRRIEEQAKTRIPATPAGKSAPATRPRRSSNAMSSASANS